MTIDPFNVSCPYCGVLNGSPCKNSRKKYRNGQYHSRRRLAAAKAGYMQELELSLSFWRYEKLFTADQLEGLIKLAASKDKSEARKIVGYLVSYIGSDESPFMASDSIDLLFNKFIDEV